MKNICITLIALLGCIGPVSAQTTEQLLLEGWHFQKGAVSDATKPDFDDSRWEQVTIPHDWAISGPFDKEIDKQIVAIVQNLETVPTEKTGRSGSLPWIGEGWYRTTISIPEGFSSAELVFDGAMSEPHVWVDGKDVGNWAYGYNVFSLDITQATGGCKAGEHTVAVHLQNLGESTRWYPGSGLYRPVHLLLHPDRYIKNWGIFAHTTKLTDVSDDYTTAREARLHVRTEVVLDSVKDMNIRQTLLDPKGEKVAEHTHGVNESKFSNSVFIVSDARLWSPEHPVLYTLVTELIDAGIADSGKQVCDRKETRIGIRETVYDTEGFHLNGELRKFKGVCLHHDLGPLGAAFNKAAFRRQLRLLKDMGCDAIRTSHNMPCPWQMDICDEMGMMVMAESFDMWQYSKCGNGYGRFFFDWWERDLTQLVLVHRNHPSLVMYSIGNEIPEQGKPEGYHSTKAMLNLMHSLDDTRPCTQGCDQGTYSAWGGAWQEMDVPGFNYRLYVYEEGHQMAPRGIVLGTETTATVSSRGVYKFPVTEEKGRNYGDGQMSSYDLDAAYWSNLPDDDWMWQDKKPWVIGEFVWSGFDYLGEPTPYDEYWPSRSSYFGIFDLAGLPKDRALLYRSRWNRQSPTLHVLPHWTWPGREGEVTPVFVYTSYPEAEVFVNGKSQGRCRHLDVTMEDYLAGKGNNRLDRMRMRWNDVRYEAGELKVVAYDAEGRVAETKTVRTAGSPHHLQLTADRSRLSRTAVDADGKAADCPDMAFVTVQVVDKDGNVCPDADCQLNFSVKGAGKFRACCNGDATSTEVFTQPTMKAFHGQLVVVVEAGKQAGDILLTASGKGMGRKGNIKIEVE